MSNVKLCESDKKTKTISIKCTKQERYKLEKAASKKGMSVSSYALEGALAGRERQCTKDKRNTTHMVMEQEMLNELYRSIPENEQALRAVWENMAKEAQKIWEF